MKKILLLVSCMLVFCISLSGCSMMSVLTDILTVNSSLVNDIDEDDNVYHTDDGDFLYDNLIVILDDSCEDVVSLIDSICTKYNANYDAFMDDEAIYSLTFPDHKTYDELCIMKDEIASLDGVAQCELNPVFSVEIDSSDSSFDD